MTVLFTSIVLFKKWLLVHIWHRAFSDHRVRKFSLYAILNSWKLILRFIFEWAFYIYSNRMCSYSYLLRKKLHEMRNLYSIYVAWYKFNMCQNATLEIWSKSRIAERLCFKSGNFVMTSHQDRSHPSLLWNKHN